MAKSMNCPLPVERYLQTFAQDKTLLCVTMPVFDTFDPPDPWLELKAARKGQSGFWSLEAKLEELKPRISVADHEEIRNEYDNIHDKFMCLVESVEKREDNFRIYNCISPSIYTRERYETERELQKDIDEKMIILRAIILDWEKRLSNSELWEKEREVQNLKIQLNAQTTCHQEQLGDLRTKLNESGSLKCKLEVDMGYLKGKLAVAESEAQSLRASSQEQRRYFSEYKHSTKAKFQDAQSSIITLTSKKKILEEKLKTYEKENARLQTALASKPTNNPDPIVVNLTSEKRSLESRVAILQVENQANELKLRNSIMSEEQYSTQNQRLRNVQGSQEARLESLSNESSELRSEISILKTSFRGKQQDNDELKEKLRVQKVKTQSIKKELDSEREKLASVRKDLRDVHRDYQSQVLKVATEEQSLRKRLEHGHATLLTLASEFSLDAPEIMSSDNPIIRQPNQTPENLQNTRQNHAVTSSSGRMDQQGANRMVLARNGDGSRLSPTSRAKVCQRAQTLRENVHSTVDHLTESELKEWQDALVEAATMVPGEGYHLVHPVSTPFVLILIAAI